MHEYSKLTIFQKGGVLDSEELEITFATEIDVYICNPHYPWQRGTIGNTNCLLRKYFPKGMDLSIHSKAKLSAVARLLNERPRKTLQYQASEEEFSKCVASFRSNRNATQSHIGWFSPFLGEWPVWES